MTDEANSVAPARDYRGMLGSAVLIVVGLLALYHSGEFSPLGSVFPRTVAIAMIVLSAVYIAVGWLRPKAPAPLAMGSVWRRLALAATMLAWAVLLEPLGFLASSVLAYAALLVIANYDRWTPRSAVIYVAAGSLIIGALYWVFRFGLQVPLPQGIVL